MQRRDGVTAEERGRAVKQWAFPWMDPHEANDTRINYAQGSGQAELATVDGTMKKKRGWVASMGSAVDVTRGIIS